MVLSHALSHAHVPHAFGGALALAHHVADPRGANDIDDTDVPILSATDLAVFKALFDRLKDWADIEELLRYGEVDRDEVLRWLAAVVGADDERLARFRETAQRVDHAPPAPTTAELFRRQDR